MPAKKKTSLNIWMNGELVGNWKVSRGIHKFSYAESWYDFPGQRPISLSLPLQYFGYKHTGDVVENYFDNLLDKIFQTATQSIENVDSMLPASFQSETAEGIFNGFLSAVKKLKG